MLVLLSPAKTLSPTLPTLPEIQNELTDPLALQHAVAIVQRLSTWSLAKTQKELKLSDTLAQRVFEWHQSWDPASPFAAGWTFQGDAFKPWIFTRGASKMPVKRPRGCAFCTASTESFAP